MGSDSPARPQEQTVVPFRTAVRAWFLISLQTFGGPAGQIAVAAFLALALFGVPFPVVVALAGIAGWALGRWRPSWVRQKGKAEAADAGPPPVIADDVLHCEPPKGRRTLRVLLVGLLVWSVPVAAVALLTGAGSVFTQQGVFFSGAAVVTFGGAYAVLAYVAQQAVTVYGWLGPREMVRGLALAETTPWPLSWPRCWSPG